MRVASAVAAVVAVGCLVNPAAGFTASIGVFCDAGAMFKG